MTILAVDNDGIRLDGLTRSLEAAFPEATVLAFGDPFRAIQYLSDNGAELAFVDSGLKPFDVFIFAELAVGYREDVTVYMVANGAGWHDTCDWKYITGVLVRPVTTEILQELVRQNITTQ